MPDRNKRDQTNRPDRPQVGVGVVVWRGDRVLLIKRATPPQAGHWSLPGGRQELGETLFETARREAFEEAGVEVRPRAVLTAVDAIHKDEEGGIAWHYTIVDVVADWVGGDGEPGDDASAVMWATLDEVDRLVAWASTREVIRMGRPRRAAPPTEDEPGAGDGPRLKPRPALGRILQSPLGGLLARPWLDSVSIRLLADWFFPMSRVWAAAIQSGGDLDRFAAEIPLPRNQIKAGRWLETGIAATVGLAERLDRATTRWEEMVFRGEGTLNEAIEAEEERIDAATALGFARLRFALFIRGRQIEACRWDLSGPDALLEAEAERIARPEAAYLLPERPPLVTVSRMLPSHIAEERWIRFDSPEQRVASPLVARVFTPFGRENPPTVVVMHGICMENDHFRGPLNEVQDLLGRGFRVILPEAPWHGFRRMPGRYAGEPLVATAPAGALLHFSAHIRELGLVTHWARATSSGPVGWIGFSLGAFTTQLATAHAGWWPEDSRPDAVMLIASTEGLDAVTLTGSMAKAFGLDRQLRAHGWTQESLRLLRPLTDPIFPPACGSNRVVLVLGDRDTIAPPDRALDIAERWRIPSSQVHLRPQGHFSVHAGALVDQRPVAQFLDLLTTR